MPFQERPYQTEALAANLTEYDAGIRRMMNVMATGTGKTVTFSKLKEKFKSRLPGQLLVLAHTDELVTQNLTKIQEENPTLKVEKEMAGTYADPQADIISASVATLGRAGTKRLDRFNWETIDKIVIDEAHHATGDAYGRILERSGVMLPATSKLLLGVTATSQRPDGRALSEIFEKVAFQYSLRQAIHDEWLVPIRGYRVSTETVLDEVSRSGADFARGELATTVNTVERNKRVVESWLKLGENRQTVVFTVDIDHAKKLAEEFTKAGINTEAVWGDDPDRAEKLKRHQSGETKVLCNCQVLVEGYDDPTIACVVLARPTASFLLFIQMIGRGTRLCPGKTDLIVIDVVDNTSHHSLVTLPTLMGLARDLDLKGRDLLEVVEEIEAMQLEHPTLPFDKLKSVDELKTIVQTVDMFEIRFPKEVEENSSLTWYRAVGGGYKIVFPPAGFLKMAENPLGYWDIEGRILDTPLKAARGTMEEAFKACDEQLHKRLGKMYLSRILREATWHGKPVTAGQKKMLERLFPWKTFQYNLMNSGQASRMISEKLARRVK